jgi:GT2 family glycosyltransferase
MKNIFIILNYNDYETTLKLLKSIKNFKLIYKIIIVDNASSDSSYELLKKEANNKIIVIKTISNNGFSSGNNIGIKEAQKYEPDNLIISNPDIIINEKTYDNLIDLINNNKNISVLAPNVKEDNTLNRGWKLTNIKDEMKLSIPHYGKVNRNKIIGYRDNYYKNEITNVDVVSGCFFIIRNNVIKDINYFDENVFLYYEENILASKLKQHGYKTYIANNEFIIHNHSVSINKSHSNLNKFKILKKSQNYYLKHYCQSNYFYLILLKLFSFITYLGIKINSKKN